MMLYDKTKLTMYLCNRGKCCNTHSFISCWFTLWKTNLPPPHWHNSRTRRTMEKFAGNLFFTVVLKSDTLSAIALPTLVLLNSQTKSQTYHLFFIYFKNIKNKDKFIFVVFQSSSLQETVSVIRHRPGELYSHNFIFSLRHWGPVFGEANFSILLHYPLTLFR